MRPEERLTGRSRDPIHCTAPLAMAIHPKTPFDTNTPVPTSPRQMSHEMRVGEPTICGQDDGALEGKPFNHLIQHLLVYTISHTTAWMFQDFPDDWNSPSTIDE